MRLLDAPQTPLVQVASLSGSRGQDTITLTASSAVDDPKSSVTVTSNGPGQPRPMPTTSV